jgi:DNA-binding LacI/PurR family transcriptional regulator
MAASLKQIARECGVSISTASRALNGHPSVNPVTRERILAAAGRVGYRPNNAARALRSRSSSTIGVVLPDMLNNFYAACTAVLQEQFEQNGYGMVLAVTRNDPSREREALQRLSSAQVEGLVLVPTSRRWELPDPKVPVVEMNRHSSRSGIDVVQSEEREGSRQVLEHLLSHGHERIAVIVGEPQFSTTVERVDGARQALEAAGLQLPAELLLAGQHTRAWGAHAFRIAWALDPRPTAVFAASSELALGALHAAQQLMVSIPHDVSLAAFGDPAWFEVCQPPLTCFEQPLREVGMITAQLLLSRLSGDQTDPRASRVRVGGRLMVRKSVAAPGVAST